jgi:hypothetical protein
MPIVYQIRERKTGKRYIGATKHSLERRWRQHVAQARFGSPRPLHIAIRAAGPEAFKLKVLKRDLTWEQALCEEARLIRHHHSNEIGFNASLGCFGVCALVGTPRSWLPFPHGLASVFRLPARAFARMLRRS